MPKSGSVTSSEQPEVSTRSKLSRTGRPATTSIAEGS